MGSEQQRLLIVANRLPVTLTPLDKGGYDFQSSSGGLAAGLNGLGARSKWIGWPGLEVPRRDIKPLEKKLAAEFNAVPVWLSNTMAKHHYNGFSNQILWPILHGFRDKMVPDDTATLAYEAVNRLFAKEIAPHIKRHDHIWIHDYHLMLLPLYLREELGDAGSDVKIGFFLHTPFPETNDWSAMPFNDQILRGVLSSNLVGFHTQEYATNFKRCCRDILDTDANEHEVHIDGRSVEVGNFPIGISPEEFDKLLADREVQAGLSALKQQLAGTKTIVGVDRTDYIKGIPEKLRAFDKFLSDYPEKKGKTKLIQVAIPSREDCVEYEKVVREVEALVGEINGKHSSITYTPIRFIHHAISKTDLTALYAASDACLITSIRDGLNLVSYEYIACQQERNGVLILSKNTGAAATLAESLQVDPMDIDGLVQSIKQALEMDYEERKRRQQASLKVVRNSTSAAWGASFTKRLGEAK